MILRSPEIWHRDDFALLCNWRKLWTAVEIGVDRGEFANTFLSRWQGRMYYGVDPYLSYAEMPASRNGDKAVAAIRFERHAAKARLVVDTSEHFAEAIQGIAEFRSHTGETIREHQPLPGNTQVDFVYIDGDHSYESTIADMERWWQLLSPHGILAGHDFNCWGGVERAVQEFSRDMRTYLTNDWPNSWYIYKNGIPSNNWVRNDWKPSQFCH